MLLESHNVMRLTVELLVDSKSFHEWESNVSQLIEFKAVLRPPNPDFGKFRERELFPLLSQTNADSVTIDARKAKDSEGSLNVDGTILQDFIEYGEIGYSTITAVGLRGSSRVRYDSRARPVADRITPQEPLSKEALWELLKRVLRQRSDAA